MRISGKTYPLFAGVCGWNLRLMRIVDKISIFDTYPDRHGRENNILMLAKNRQRHPAWVLVVLPREAALQVNHPPSIIECKSSRLINLANLKQEASRVYLHQTQYQYRRNKYIGAESSRKANNTFAIGGGSEGLELPGVIQTMRPLIEIHLT
jgi:hypothetical protein